MLNIDLNAYAKKQLQLEPSSEKSFAEFIPETVETGLNFNGKLNRRVEDSLSGVADCSNCPASGTWNYAGYHGKQLCFHQAYYIGKSGKPVVCDIANLNCPKTPKKGI